MPVTPFPIDITVNDTDNSTAKVGARIFIRNTTKKSTLTTDTNGDDIITDSSGNALVDLANLPLITGQTEEYSQGDKILIIGHDGVTHDASFYTVAGADHTLTLNLNPAQFQGHVVDSQKLQGLVAANTTGVVYEVKVYAVDDGELLCQLECPANETVDVVFGGQQGKAASGGFVIERENSGVVVTATFK